MEQGEQEYPPGTVGYLAQGRGWRTAPVSDWAEDDTEHPDPAPPREARLATPVPEQPPGAAEPGDVHTDEDEEEDDRRVPHSLFDDFAHEKPAYREGFTGDLMDELDPPDPDEEDGADANGAISNGAVGDGAVGDGAVGDGAVGDGAVGGGDRAAAAGSVEVFPEPEAAYSAGPERAVPRSEAPSWEAAPEPPERGPEPAAGRVARPTGSAEPRSTARWVEPGALAAQQAQRARNGSLAADDSDLASARLLRPGRRPPRSGWRRALYLLSGRTINLGEGPADLNERELITRINQPLQGCYKIAMLSLKGGVGKTTVTATLGATFASLRGDRVIAVDANPDRGTLSQKIPLETSATVRHLLRDAQRVRRYTDVRAYTSQGPSRLEVLASEQDPAVSEAFSEAEYRRTVNLLEHFYNVVLTDCGTGLMHSAMYGVLGLADALVIVSSGSIDGARSASATMDWLDAHGHGELVANSVAVINSVRRNSGAVDLDRVAEHFAARCRAVVKIPFDAHLDEGAEVDLDRLSVHTRTSLLELAAAVADAFPSGKT